MVAESKKHPQFFRSQKYLKTSREIENDKDADKIRNGFATAIFNSRGVHWVDPSGKPEMELSAKYKKQADDAENAGYQRLAHHNERHSRLVCQ